MNYVNCASCFTVSNNSSTEREKYGRTYGEELIWDLDNHGTMVAGIIKEKGPFNIRFYNFKVSHCVTFTLVLYFVIVFYTSKMKYLLGLILFESHLNLCLADQ